jgi:hypothetical protein
MAVTTKIEKEARRLCTHTIVFTDPVDKLVAVRAMQGRTTKAIARELHITQHEAQYRVSKAQRSVGTRFRADYRDGSGPVAKKMLKATEIIGLQVVEHDIAPKFIPFARQGVSRVS